MKITQTKSSNYPQLQAKSIFQLSINNQMQLRLIFAFLLFSMTFTVTAQISISTSIEDNFIVVEETNESWVLFESTTDKKILIDFESIQSTVSDIRIKTATDEIEFTDVVDDLPQDAIYELDLSMLSEGSYTIEVRTFKEVLTKEITL
ncbi:MAG: hypothetical protein AB8G11_07550 [Saprospiraceae bacterium]